MTINYSLGSHSKERDRLKFQVDLYEDTAGVTFGAAETVCDIGCGPGSNLWIAQQARAGKYIGIDIDNNQIETAIQTAKELSLHNTEFHHTDGNHLPLSGQIADATFTRCVLIHQPEPLKLAREMYRITKLGGRIIAIEPHAPTYYCSPEHDHLAKCYRARTNYVYSNGKGSPDIALNLYPLFKKLGLNKITIKPHIIAVCGRTNIERSKGLLANWLGQIKTVSKELIANKLITEEDLEQAGKEAESVTDETFIYQSLWIAQGIK